MNISLKSIKREVVMRPPRIILLGTEKIGKSTFAAGADSPIFIPIKMEEGIDELDVPSFPVCNSFDDVMSCLRALDNEEHDFKTVIIDSGSALEPVIWEHVCQEDNVKSIELVGGGFAKGYTEAMMKWRDITEGLDYLRAEKNMASIIIGHTKVKRFDDPERASYNQYQFDINDKVSAMLYRWADFVGFASNTVLIVEEKVGFNKKLIKAVEAEEDARVLYTKKTPVHPGGGRGVLGRLPSEIPLDWQSFKATVSEVLAEEAKEKKKAKK